MLYVPHLCTGLCKQHQDEKEDMNITAEVMHYITRTIKILRLGYPSKLGDDIQKSCNTRPFCLHDKFQ